jgi:hypothetical protein
MSFFDKLKRIISAINSNIPKDIKSSINNITKDLDDDISNSINKSEEKKSIPNIYSDFPVFDGEITKISEKSTSKYTRCILDYENISSLDFEDYLYDITRAGYIQESNIKYAKKNTYIIVVYSQTSLHIIFHINK